MNRALPKLVPKSWRRSILYILRHPHLVGHSGQQGIYDAMRKDNFRPNMERVVFHTVKDCHSCATSGTWLKPKRYFKLFPATGLLQFIAMDIFEPLSKAAKGVQYERRDYFRQVIRVQKNGPNRSNHNTNCGV